MYHTFQSYNIGYTWSLGFLLFIGILKLGIIITSIFSPKKAKEEKRIFNNNNNNNILYCPLKRQIYLYTGYRHVI